MLQEFYKRADKIMHLETAWEAVLAWRSTLAEALREGMQAGKSTTTKKNEDNKKRKSGDCRRSLDPHKKKAKSSDQRVPRSLLSKYVYKTEIYIYYAIAHVAIK